MDNGLVVAKEAHNLKNIQITQKQISQHQLIVDSKHAQRHTPLLLCFLEAELLANHPILIVQYESDHNKTAIQGLLHKHNQMDKWIELSEHNISSVISNLKSNQNYKQVIYVDLKAKKDLFSVIFKDLISTILSRNSQSKPLHAFVTHLNLLNHSIWSEIAGVGYGSNIRLTAVYNHYADTLKSDNQMFHKYIIVNTGTQFIFPQDPECFDLVRQDFNLAISKQGVLAKIKGLFVQQATIDSLKEDQLLYVNHGTAKIAKLQN